MNVMYDAYNAPRASAISPKPISPLTEPQQWRVRRTQMSGRHVAGKIFLAARQYVLWQIPNAKIDYIFLVTVSGRTIVQMPPLPSTQTTFHCGQRPRSLIRPGGSCLANIRTGCGPRGGC